MRETDLFEPIAEWFRIQGFVVYSEVCGCDVVAVKDGEVHVCELKPHLNPTVIVQCLKRRKYTNHLYVAARKCEGNAVVLANHLQIKVLEVRESGEIRAAHIPHDYIPPYPDRYGMDDMDRELRGRTGCYSPGGAVGGGGVTSWMEGQIKIAACIKQRGHPLMKRELRAMGCDERSLTHLRVDSILKWFASGITDTGRRLNGCRWSLTERGEKEISDRYAEPFRVHLEAIGNETTS